MAAPLLLAQFLAMPIPHRLLAELRQSVELYEPDSAEYAVCAYDQFFLVHRFRFRGFGGLVWGRDQYASPCIRQLGWRLEREQSLAAVLARERAVAACVSRSVAAACALRRRGLPDELVFPVVALAFWVL